MQSLRQEVARSFLLSHMSSSSSRRVPSSALVVGAVVGVVTLAYVAYYYSSRKDDDDAMKDYRKDINPDGFAPGDAPMEDLRPPDTASRGSAVDNKDTTRVKLSLADIIISEPTAEESAQMVQPLVVAEPLSLPPAVPSSSSLPRQAAKSYTMDGVPTDMFVQVFGDRIVVGVSQLKGKFGNYMLCEAIPDEVNPKHVDYDVTTLLGAREDTVLTVYARQITQRIEKLQPNPIALNVIVAISLNKTKAPQPEVFNAIVDLLVNLYCQAMGS